MNKLELYCLMESDFALTESSKLLEVSPEYIMKKMSSAAMKGASLPEHMRDTVQVGLRKGVPKDAKEFERQRGRLLKGLRGRGGLAKQTGHKFGASTTKKAQEWNKIAAEKRGAVDSAKTEEELQKAKEELSQHLKTRNAYSEGVRVLGTHNPSLNKIKAEQAGGIHPHLITAAKGILGAIAAGGGAYALHGGATALHNAYTGGKGIGHLLTQDKIGKYLIPVGVGGELIGANMTSRDRD